MHLLHERGMMMTMPPHERTTRTDDTHRWFTALAELENVSDAAATLGIAQPTLSRRLAALERDVGAPLFDRPGRRLILNEAGAIYADAARRCTMTMDVAHQRISELTDTREATLRLGFLHSFGPWLVPQLLRLVREHHPHTAFRLVQDAAGSIERLVDDGDLDIAVVSPRPSHGSPLAWRRLLAQPIAAAVPLGHPLATREAVRLPELAGEPFVTMPAHYGMRTVLEEACATAGFRPLIGTECQELGTVAGLVEGGLGVALLPVEGTAAHRPGLRLIPLEHPRLHREIGLVWARDRALPAAARLVRDDAVITTAESSH